MKKIIPLLAFIIILTNSCQKEIPRKLTGYFYTSDSSSNEAQNLLYVDGKLIGNLPNMNITISAFPSLNDTIFKQNALKLEMLSGTHIIEMRSSAGVTLSQSETYFKFYKNKESTGVKGSMGGCSLQYDDLVFSFGIYQ